MKKFNFPAAALICLVFTACQKQMSDSTNTLLTPSQTTASIITMPTPAFVWWTHPTDLPMPDDFYIGWELGLGFAINGKGYTFCGRLNSIQHTTLHLPSLWEYDPATRIWTPKADFPGPADIKNCSFVIGSTLYVCAYNTCWAWDQTTNTWTAKASFPSHRRLNSSAFAINGKGYVGLGVDVDVNTYPYMKDWWEYDPVADSWSRKKDFPGGAREYAPAFAVGNYGYICGGMKATSGEDLWRYDPSTDTWLQKTTPPTTGLAGGIGLSGVVNGGTPTGFVVQGISHGCLEYTPATDKWGILPDVPGASARYNAAGFMIGRSLYVAGGVGPTTSQFHKDVQALNWSK